MSVVIILSINSEFKISSIKITLNYVNIDVYTVDIVKSDTINIIDESDCSFHNWHYMTIFFQFSSQTDKNFIKLICLNTECIMSLVDKKFL